MEKKHSSKVIAFPGADARLVEKANKANNQGDYGEARRLFELAFTRDEEEDKVTPVKSVDAAEMNFKVQLHQATDSEKLHWIYELSRANIRAYLDVVKTFLVADNHPLLKSLLLSSLIDQEVDEPVRVTKFDKLIELIPNETPKVEESRFVKAMESYLKQAIANDNPSLYEQAIAFVHDQNLLLFPLQMDGLDDWAVAYHFYLNELFGVPNQVELTMLARKKLQFIKTLDQISPINL